MGIVIKQATGHFEKRNRLPFRFEEGKGLSLDGLSFPCDASGTVHLLAMNKAERENWNTVLSGDVDGREPIQIEVREVDVWVDEPAIGDCQCGKQFEFLGSFTGKCQCGLSYTMDGELTIASQRKQIAAAA